MEKTKEELKELIDYYRYEWKYAEKDGDTFYAESYKKYYTELVLEYLKEPYNERHEALKQFPLIMLN